MGRIPVYEIKVPEYRLKRLNKKSQKIDYAGTPWLNIEIPKAYYDCKPDFSKIGKKIDTVLKQNFLGQDVVIRALGSQEHKSKNIDEMIEIIRKIGHDKYDPKRKGDRYENIEGKRIDFFALPFKIEKNGHYAEQFLEPFYFWPIHERGYPVRVDILIVYNPSGLSAVEHSYKGRKKEIKDDGFVFKYPSNKPGAVKAIIKII